MLYNVTNQIPMVNVGNLSVSNLNVSSNIVTTTGGFTIHTITGFIYYPTGSTTSFFVNSTGDPIEIPKGSVITQSTLSTIGDTISPSSGAFLRIFVRSQSNSVSISLYDPVVNSSLNEGKVLVYSKAVGNSGSAPDILDKVHRVYAESAPEITTGILRIIIQYQIPV